MNRLPLAVSLLLVASLSCVRAAEPSCLIELKRDDAVGRMQVLISGKETIDYLYDQELEMAHFFPVRSPSGKSLTVQKTTPYPHHRSFWFADKVVFEGGTNGFYEAYYSSADRKNPAPPFRNRIRHTGFLADRFEKDQAETGMKLVWEADRKKAVIDELRTMRVVALGKGEYFLDLRFTVTASHGDVKFVSDAVHYAWPFLRMDPQFAPEKGGGTLTNSEGVAGQKATCNQPARWVDCSNTVEGVTEGLAFFTHPDMGPPPKWLTRDYGTFGPRRPDEQSGKPFVLKKGESLKQRVGILVHTGDVKTGKVEERYQQYAAGRL